jgi:prevent-host-death family protein
MILVSIVDVKAKLSEYLERAVRGERILICRHNKPVAELRPVEGARAEPRPVGPLPQRPTFEVPPSFFEPLTDGDLELWDRVSGRDPLSPAWVPPGNQRPGKVAERKRSDAAHGHRRRRRKP